MTHRNVIFLYLVDRFFDIKNAELFYLYVDLQKLRKVLFGTVIILRYLQE